MAESLPTYYDLLQVEQDASPERVRAAWRKLAHKYHPDKMPGNANAARAMAAINAAYEVLSDPARRAEHDLWIRRSRQLQQPRPPVHPVPATLWAFVHPARQWPWYVLCATLVFVLCTMGAALYLTAMPARAQAPQAPQAQLCKPVQPAPAPADCPAP